MKDIITRHKAGEDLGICSVCSAHPLVIEAALRFDLHTDNKVLIEATSNQVNQFGGYTGMKPADFRDFVLKIAKEVGFPHERLILGGDLLGPNCWQNEPADAAMEKSIGDIAGARLGARPGDGRKDEGPKSGVGPGLEAVIADSRVSRREMASFNWRPSAGSLLAAPGARASCSTWRVMESSR